MRAGFAHGFFSWRNAGAVDEAHQLAQRQGLGDDGLAVGFLADIAFDKSAADFLGNRLAFFSLHVGNHDLGAVVRQHARRAFAQARCAAGDDKYFACDIHEMFP